MQTFARIFFPTLHPQWESSNHRLKIAVTQKVQQGCNVLFPLGLFLFCQRAEFTVISVESC